MKIWGHVDEEKGVIVNADSPAFTAQCLRVPVSDGHMAAVFASFKNKPSKEEILSCWKNFSGRAQELQLPSDYKFVCLSHNTLRGAAGGAVLMAELLCAEGYMD